MNVGPGADGDRVDAVVVEQFLPVGIGSGNIEFVRDPLTGFEAAIGHRHDLTSGNLSKAGDLNATDIGAGSDETDPNDVLGVLPLGSVPHALLSHPPTRRLVLASFGVSRRPLSMAVGPEDFSHTASRGPMA